MTKKALFFFFSVQISMRGHSKARGKVALRVLLFHSCWGKLCSYFEATSPPSSSGCFSQISLRMNIECQTKRKLGQSIAFFKQVPSPLSRHLPSFIHSHGSISDGWGRYKVGMQKGLIQQNCYRSFSKEITITNHCNFCRDLGSTEVIFVLFQHFLLMLSK